MAKILMVDDSPTQQEALRRLLIKQGHEVIIANNGLQGIEIAKRENPALILMDIVMPEINGFQATRQLSSDPDTASIPVVIVSTKDQSFDRTYGLRQGAKGYLTKPPSEQELLDTIQPLLKAS